ncbi:hypothetical protein FR943_01550 [Mycobacterium sp. TNTM28]|uniref:Uncharacterized protein n=1 Tax=[Mycobacterium] fortunisiensis TaxID=2600579 RepID=A0ABS6KG62_9MYCO|nr:hypothetical protein [[Mycobacterium] fortunisiensis]MBU9762537.1 hypothetical protein [[Mycobacterium] fortunisiensis]
MGGIRRHRRFLREFRERIQRRQRQSSIERRFVFVVHRDRPTPQGEIAETNGGQTVGRSNPLGRGRIHRKKRQEHGEPFRRRCEIA